jgi:hypothetical protein
MTTIYPFRARTTKARKPRRVNWATYQAIVYEAIYQHLDELRLWPMGLPSDAVQRLTDAVMAHHWPKKFRTVTGDLVEGRDSIGCDGAADSCSGLYALPGMGNNDASLVEDETGL